MPVHPDFWSQLERMIRDGGNYIIEDLNSSNGTHVGSQRVKRRVLCDGDVVKVADIPLKFVFR